MLKQTRNLFILDSESASLTNLVLGDLKFKGLAVLRAPTSHTNIRNIFKNNKSIACSNTFSGLNLDDWDYVKIDVVESLSEKKCDDTIVTELGNIANQFEAIALKHNRDIGDHISNSSGLSGMPTIDDCSYCQFLKGTFNKYSQKILYETSNFFVMATVGQFIKGYLLIIPKDHVMSIAQLSPELQQEFLEVLEDITHILKLTYNCSNVLVWENGTGNSGKGKAKDSVVHAHVHIAPSTLSARKIQQISQLPFTRIYFDMLYKYQNNSYLLIRDTFNNCWCINNNPDTYIPRQYIRQLLADEYKIEGNDLWNWRIHPYFELIQETNNDILNTLQNNYDSLSNRIKLNIN